MEVIVAFAAWGLRAICSQAGMSGGLCPTIPNASADLGPLLSKQAHIYLPGSNEFGEKSTRWQEYNKPDITTVVEVASENDVVETIRYANRNNRPFLAVGGGHGLAGDLGGVEDGIAIRMRSMKSVSISPDGDTATLGGGVLSKEVIDGLWTAGKQTVTGFCECTGLLGLGLGGGHGLLQGKYGNVADQWISARIVLANGTAITVSDDANPDLWWAIRGAGHNFGVVTSIVSKVYTAPKGDWAWETLIFTHDKVEKIYEAINEFARQTETIEEVMNYSAYIRIPDVDPRHPVIVLHLLYRGPHSKLKHLSSPFHALNPVAANGGVKPYPLIPATIGFDLAAPPCQPGLAGRTFPIRLHEYNPEAQRQVFDEFDKTTTAQPAFNGSFFMFEGYSNVGMKSKADDATAYPHRKLPLLVAPYINWVPDVKMSNKAIAFGNRLRDILRKGSSMEELHSYVNYAEGSETLEENYGTEPWRLERLRALKEKYDPSGKFNFYNPIIQ